VQFGLTLSSLSLTDPVVQQASKLITKHRLFDERLPRLDGKGRKRYRPIPRQASESTFLQPRWSAAVRLMFSLLVTHHELVDSNAFPTIGTAKPDGVAYPRVRAAAFCCIV
jgi:hypothetical protein